MEGRGQRYSMNCFVEVVHLPVSRKMNQVISSKRPWVVDVKQLFHAMGDTDGSLEFSEVLLFFEEILEPPADEEEIDLIVTFTDCDKDKTVSYLEMFGALTSD